MTFLGFLAPDEYIEKGLAYRPIHFSGRPTMKAKSLAYVLLAMGVASGTLRSEVSSELGPDAVSSEGRADAAPKWEYRILTKEQILEVGKKDLAAGLNKLGDQGWELAAVETAFIFKRPKPQNGRRIEDVKSRIALIEADLEKWKDRVAWSERMLKKGFLSEAQVNGERLELKKTEIALDYLNRELQSLSPDVKVPASNRTPPRQPEPIKAPKPQPPP
jgi:hypothetical protein